MITLKLPSKVFYLLFINLFASFKTDNWQSAKELSLEASRTEAFVRNLTPVTDYELRMATVNDIGQSRWSNLLTITTEEEGNQSIFSMIIRM